MIKTIILLVIVFYTFPCRKINAQSRDTSNIFAGYYIAVYNKSDLSHKKIRRHHKHSYNTAIDSRYRTYFIPIKIGKNNINQENIWKEVTDNKTESDTIFIFPDSTDIKLFKQIGLIDSNISDKKHLLLQEIKSLPYYNTASNKAYLFKCLYVKGTFLQLRIDTIDKNWQDYLLDIYSISTKKKKKLLLVTGIDSLHSIKSDGTSIQARPYIKTGQQKPCTALIVGNWFAGEEGYIRKEALLEQGEPFVSWIRCNDCPQIRFNESNSGSVVYPGPPVSWNDPSNPDDPQAGYGYIPNDTTKEETFFYHSDHLGSTSYITDDHANITQYDAYLPYGELLVDEHSSSEELPYKFNGKQFDEETGLYYYGARYMNPVTSLWYGVDPKCYKNIHLGSYVYCSSNPIVRIDPNGEDDYVTNVKTGAIAIIRTKDNTHSFYITNGQKTIEVGTYKYNSHNLIGMSGKVSFSNFEGAESRITFKSGNEKENYISPLALAALIGATSDVGANDVYVNHFSNADGSSPAPSHSHKNGINGDLRYFSKDHSGSRRLVSDAQFDEEREIRFVKALHKYGWAQTKSMMVSERYGNHKLLPYTWSAKEHKIPSAHNNHLHLQGFRPNVSTMYYGGNLNEVVVMTKVNHHE